MKKNVLLVAALFSAAFATTQLQAQDFKPAAGEKTLEVNFAPLGGSPISINELRFRSFTSATTALRLGISIAYSRENQAPVTDSSRNFGTPTEPDYLVEELVDYDSEMGITLMPGFEKHFAGTERLSPYIGGVATIGYYRSTSVQKAFGDADQTNTTDTKEEWDVYSRKAKDGSLDLGLNLVLGADWYFSPKIYLGMEVGFGFLYSSNSDLKVEYSDIELTDDQQKLWESETPQGSEFDLGPNYNAGIRLGYAF